MSTTRELLERVAAGWLADPESDVHWVGEVDGRLVVRMRQTVRDATAVWFEVGERTLGVEAYVMSPPPDAPAEILRQALVRNHSTRRIHFALDPRNDLVLVGRIPLEEVSSHELELALGEVYGLVERAVPAMTRVLRGWRSPREKTP